MKAHFHLPGLFEYYDLYRKFLPLFYNHRDYFYDWVEIESIYGAPMNCIWSGGRIGINEINPYEVRNLMNTYNISSRLTFSNSLLNEKHLEDMKCNELCRIFEQANNGIIIYSDLLLEYIRSTYPKFYFVSSTTKVLTDFNDFIKEVNKDEFKYVVADFRFNKSFDQLKEIEHKEKVEFLCNECCWIGCKERKECYEAVSHQNLKEDFNFVCKAPNFENGYQFSKAIENPSFISIEDIQSIYLPMGFNQFKIEGRGLGSALILEFLLYYLTKPQYQIHVREAIYLDNMLDLF